MLDATFYNRLNRTTILTIASRRVHYCMETPFHLLQSNFWHSIPISTNGLVNHKVVSKRLWFSVVNFLVTWGLGLVHDLNLFFKPPPQGAFSQMPVVMFSLWQGVSSLDQGDQLPSTVTCWAITSFNKICPMANAVTTDTAFKKNIVLRTGSFKKIYFWQLFAMATYFLLWVISCYVSKTPTITNFSKFSVK